MEESEYSKYIIKKPWGHEYIIYENDNLAIWYLHINKGHKTSLHCHPNKKTSLIVLNGEAKLSFLSDEFDLTSLKKMIIRPGLFHSTEAITDVDLLEVEFPKKKSDIVRFKDEYGREKTPYEEKNENYLLREEDNIVIKNPIEDGVYFDSFNFGKVISLLKTSKINFLDILNLDDVIIILDGGLHFENNMVASPADALYVKTMKQLCEQFQLKENSIFMVISDEY